MLGLNLRYPLPLPLAAFIALYLSLYQRRPPEAAAYLRRIPTLSGGSSYHHQAIMGKKVKKKARSGQKEKRGPSTSPKTVSQQGISNAETPDIGVAGIIDRGLCSHIDRGINMDKLAAKLGSSESLRCEDCRGHVVDSRAKKGKHGKKGGTNSKSESKAIWICLECGHFACGGLGLPTTPQSHAVRHAKQNHHPLVVHYDNHHLLWCFPCNKLIPAEKSEDSKQKEVLKEVVKMLKGQPGEGSNVDVEDVWFGSGSVTSAIKSGHSESIGPDGRVGYSIRDESVGPLIAALRKLFLETSTEAGLRSVINPRSLFGSLCTKAPQFRGYQQHDSHELLRCLLDGLSTEELSARKHNESSEASITDPTFVDAIFGGQLSSTVSCLECGHSSTIYEPFLDLSLPVPTKKPPSRRNQPATRGKKPKLPPKKYGRNHSKISREANTRPGESVSAQSTGGNSLGELESIPQPEEQLVVSSGNSVLSDSTDPYAIALDMGLTVEDLSAIQKPKNKQAVENVGEQSVSSDCFAWLDYLEPSPISGDTDVATETDEISAIQGFANEDVPQNDISLSITLDSRDEGNLANSVSATSLDSAEHFDALGLGASTQEQDGSSQFGDKQNENPEFNGKLSLKEVVQCDADIGQSSESCSQVFSKDSNTSGRDNEIPSQTKDSEVILLPSKDVSSGVEVSRAGMEVSSSVLGDEQDSLDFDGFGDLFNEPEVPSGLKSSNNPVSEASTKNGVIGNSSESDPDEVDNADAPVSVESCLALFTKPELLFKDEHAWQCDNCSKVLRTKN
ncbi:hypothetical protein DH2020_016886 [Rehmannia glutinosa]|uniref:Ubiquitinyl hydrolase 1 n=1 Tax=Rehmannia glutinosa TaxID=99300 RepID=A0ABR0WPY0_REHGL